MRNFLKARKGNLVLFQINRDSIIYSELKSMFMKTEYFGELLRKSLRELEIDFAFIFGSFARGIESLDSDIDLFIVGDVDENDVLTIIQEIERQTKREINYILWKKADLMEKAKKHYLLNEIAKNPVIMLVGDENEFKKIIK